MKTCLTIGLAAIASAAAAITPSVTDVTMEQDPLTRNVAVGYVLSGRAVVTFSFLVGDDEIAVDNAIGDVNRVVEAGAHSISCRPDRAVAAGWASSSVRVRVTAWPLDDPPDYLVIDLAHPTQHRYYASASEIPGGPAADKYKSDWMVFRKIPAKNVRWRMGGGVEVGTRHPQWGTSTRDSEKYHYVTLDHNYYMAIYETTADHYSMIANGAPAASNGTFPAINCSYNYLRGSTGDGIDFPDTGAVVADASFVKRARNVLGIPTIDLPTEAEWEFACRAGTATAFNNGMDLADYFDPIPGGIGWDSSTGVASRQAVGQKAPNNWNLYDMHGNVGELCLDWFDSTFYAENSEQTNPVGPKTSDGTAYSTRVTRGGFWQVSAPQCRSAYRSQSWNPADTKYGWMGFRLVCAASAE
ncbi:MAG: formylglycine-generating enzyme family protein [Kiritimatiellae bacterium]|nr:formylglycine-generating enzyme family protein [Kiritimatiellia bacterium]